MNPKTGQPFAHGDLREDGYTFVRYENKLNKNGYFRETWLSPKAFDRNRSKQILANRRKYKHQGTRLLKGWAEELCNDPRQMQNCRDLWKQIVTQGMTKQEIQAAAISEDVYLLLAPYANGV